MARWAGVRNASRPIVRCQEMSQRRPRMMQVEANVTAASDHGTRRDPSGPAANGSEGGNGVAVTGSLWSRDKGAGGDPRRLPRREQVHDPMERYTHPGVPPGGADRGGVLHLQHGARIGQAGPPRETDARLGQPLRAARPVAAPRPPGPPPPAVPPDPAP